MSIPVLTRVSCDARTNSHICHPCPSEFYSLPVQHGDALRSERGTVLLVAAHWGATGLEKGTQTLLTWFRIPTRTSAIMKLLFKLPKPVSPTLSTYYPSHRDLLLWIYNASELPSVPTPFFQVINACVNMNGSPASWEVFGASATGKISLIKDYLNILITQNGSWDGYNQLTILNTGFLSILMSKLCEVQHF